MRKRCCCLFKGKFVFARFRRLAADATNRRLGRETNHCSAAVPSGSSRSEDSF